jgi:hypothetical protein
MAHKRVNGRFVEGSTRGPTVKEGADPEYMEELEKGYPKKKVPTPKKRPKKAYK